MYVFARRSILDSQLGMEQLFITLKFAEGLFFHCIWLSYQLDRKHLIIIITLFLQPRQHMKKIKMMVVSVFWYQQNDDDMMRALS